MPKAATSFEINGMGERMRLYNVVFKIFVI